MLPDTAIPKKISSNVPVLYAPERKEDIVIKPFELQGDETLPDMVNKFILVLNKLEDDINQVISNAGLEDKIVIGWDEYEQTDAGS